MIAGDPAPDGSHGPHVLTADLASPEIAPADRHHVERVLRLRAGERATLGDGRGRWQPVRWGDPPEPAGAVRFVAEPEWRIGIGIALIKGGRLEAAVRKLTELGVDDIRPFAAARSVVRWDEAKAALRFGRLTAVVREAVMQSRRAWLPTVHPLASFDAVAALPGAALAQRGAAHFAVSAPNGLCGSAAPAAAKAQGACSPGVGASGPDADRPSAARPSPAGFRSCPTLLLIGPEGGWDDAEAACGLPRVGLSAAVLRADTAAVVAGALLAARRDLS